MIAFDPAKPKGIVWLASYPRSGNTWLRTFLYQLVRIQRGLPREDGEINNLARVTRSEADFHQLHEQLLGKPLAQATQAEIITVRGRVQAAIAQNGAGPVLIRTHSLLGALGRRPTINTDASLGAVYLVRDPRDVVVSLARYTGMSVDDTIAWLNKRDANAPGDERTPDEPWGSWSQNVESWAEGANDTLLAVRYEDILEKPTEVFVRILTHLRQKAKPDEISEAIRLSSFEELKSQEEKYGFQMRPREGGKFFVNGKAGAWHDALTEPQVAAIVEAHGETMRKFGYLN